MTDTLVPSAVSPVGVNRGGNSGPRLGDTAVRAGAPRPTSPGTYDSARRTRRANAVSVHPDAITREAIAESMGIHPRGGSFGEDLGRLRGRGLIEYERGSARARDFLFAGVA
jgi:hypothetical protein